jgi:hypothetical protein
MSRPRAVIGSHLLAAGAGVLAYRLVNGNVVYASGLSLFLLLILMLLTGTFHPPAGGTAWSFIFYPQTPDAFFGLLGGTLFLSLVTLGGRDSMALNLLLYFYGTPFHRDSPVEPLNEIESILENEGEVIESKPMIDGEVWRKRLMRNEKIRKLMLLVLRDQIKDKGEELQLIDEIKEINSTLEAMETSLSEYEFKLDESLEKLRSFIEEFGED